MLLHTKFCALNVGIKLYVMELTLLSHKIFNAIIPKVMLATIKYSIMQLGDGLVFFIRIMLHITLLRNYIINSTLEVTEPCVISDKSIEPNL